MTEAMTKKRSRCEELENSVMELESLRHEVKWLRHHHNENQRTLTETKHELDQRRTELGEYQRKAEHRLSTLGLQCETKDSELQKLRAQVEAGKRREADLRKDYDNLKSLKAEEW